MSRTFLLAAVALLGLSAALPAAAAQSTTVKAKFDAQLRFGVEQPSEIAFNGSVTWAEPNLRVEITDGLTQELKVLLVNFAEANAILLYPETLNGYRASLAQLDADGHLVRLRDMLNGKSPQTPEGWKKESLGKEKIGSTQCTHLRYTRDAERRIDVWLNAQQRPLRMIVTKKDVSFTINTKEMTYGDKVPASTFSYSKDYSISDYKSDEANPLMLL